MAIRKFPPLFKKTNTGAIQRWEIGTVRTTIITEFGLVDGKKQTTQDHIKKGKNIGRSNETTAEEQADLEAQAKWMKQKKRGYVESIEAARDGKVDSVIEGGIVPMLAKVYGDYSDEIKYPVAVQPKLDGHRCLAVVDSTGGVSLWTRTRKRYTAVPHIEFQLEKIVSKMKLRNVVLDGELYSHRLRNDFEKISSAVRKKNATMDAVSIQYHIYDVNTDVCFRSRLASIADIIIYGGNTVHLVDTDFADSEVKVMELYEKHKAAGYEGAMVRLLGLGYEGKRSRQLLKLKDFQDAEFKIVDMEEGRGKLAGHCGAFVCVTESGEEFRAKMSGDTKQLKSYWEDQSNYIGDYLTVKFQGFTSGGLPRFPVGMRIREDL